MAMGKNDISYERMYQAYSGCDMAAHINNKPCGNLQALTISVTREVVPVYTMGSADAKCFVKGKRGIAGTLTFSTFDRHALLYDVFADSSWNSNLYGNAMKSLLTDSSVMYTNSIGQTSAAAAGFGSTQAVSLNGGVGTLQNVGSSVGSNMYEQAERVFNAIRSRRLQYCDQIPPFDITLTMVNEAGSASFMSLHGVVLVNEGYGFTMDDLTSETSFTYVARMVTPLRSLSNFFTDRSNFPSSR